MKKLLDHTIVQNSIILTFSDIYHGFNFKECNKFKNDVVYLSSLFLKIRLNKDENPTKYLFNSYIEYFPQTNLMRIVMELDEDELKESDEIVKIAETCVKMSDEEGTE